MEQATPLPYRILLIEDAEPDVFLVREALESHRLHVDLCVLEDGEKAVDYIDRLEQNGAAAPHLCLLDLNLPRKSGDQVLERLRQSARWKDVPVVILTSSDSPRDKAKASHYQVTEYFRKPSRLEDFMKLGALVSRLLKSLPAQD
ncbi:MAG TPA: response regulator [Bryobacteraceae bacterium]|jgi:DNA-binding response OmpR family regulator